MRPSFSCLQHCSLLAKVVLAVATSTSVLQAAPPARPLDGSGCGTTVPAGLVVDQTWTATASPYCVQGNIQVSLLTIEPGVCIRVAAGAQIDVLASLSAQGTCARPIIFSRLDGAAWNGLRFDNTAPGSALDWCVIEGATTGVTLINTSPQLRHCTIQGNVKGMSVAITGQDLQLESCKVLDNALTGSITSLRGAGIDATMTGGVLRMVDCVVAGNLISVGDGSSVGAGLAITGDSELIGCTFDGNFANADEGIPGGGSFAGGGGVHSSGGTCTIAGSILSENRTGSVSPPLGATSTSRGGGLYLASGQLTATNTIFGCNLATGDETRQGSGVYVASGSCSLVNCTVARGDVQGIVNGGGTVDLRNSIVFFNAGGGVQVSGTVTAEYCDIENGWPGTGNIAFNPVFSGSGCSTSDLRIALGSPCIDAGDGASSYDDVCFPPSLGGVRNDMGAQGGPGACSSCWASAASVVRNGSGVNPLSLGQVAAMLPVVGGCWGVDLDCSAHAPGAAFLVVFDGATSGLQTNGGELLVGGTRLFSSVTAHGGSVARFHVPIPDRLALCGRLAFAQGVCFGSPGYRLSNALDIVLGRDG